MAEFLVSSHTLAEAEYSGPEEALGKMLRYRWKDDEIEGSIIGIVNDMNLYSFHRMVYPIVFWMTPVEQHNYLSIRLDADRYSEALTAVRSTWKRLVPDFPLDYSFLDESFEALHRADIRLNDIFRIFSATAVAVACMGLFGLAVFTAEQKTKEIGIRKVLGAPFSSIYMLLSKTFVKCVILANFIAWPAAYFIMRRWLANFVYRTDLNITIFIASGFVAMAVAILTVSWQAIRAARTRTVDSLRYE
jgi:putative ABC transport system permease protein